MSGIDTTRVSVESLDSFPQSPRGVSGEWKLGLMSPSRFVGVVVLFFVGRVRSDNQK